MAEAGSVEVDRNPEVHALRIATKRLMQEFVILKDDYPRETWGRIRG